jgi:E3 ubiquitin-protein ligase NRDP1
MGFERWRFQRQSFPIELICGLCEEVLEDPQQCSLCKKFYCKHCLVSKRKIHQDCLHPLGSLAKPNRFLVLKLAGLELSCRFSRSGCTYKGKTNAVVKHEKACEFGESPSSPVKIRNVSPEKSLIVESPVKIILCPRGCGKRFSLAEQEDHDCLKELIQITRMQQERNSRIQSELHNKREELNEIRSDLGSYQITENDRILKLTKTLSGKKETLNKLIESNAESLKQIALKHSQQMEELDQISLSQIANKVCKASSVIGEYFSDVGKFLNTYAAKNKSSFSHFRIKIKADTADFCRVDSPPRFITAKKGENLETTVSGSVLGVASKLLGSSKFKTPSKAKSLSYIATTPSTLSTTCKM